MTIPPRKRLRVDEVTVAGPEAPESTGFITAAGETHSLADEIGGTKKKMREVQFARAEEEPSDNSEDDEDFVPGHVSEGSVGSDSDDNSSSATSEASAQATISKERRRSPEHETPDTSSASGTDSSSDPSSDSESDSTPGADFDQVPSAVSDSDSDSTDSSSGSDSDSDSSAPEVLSSKKPTVPPWSGSKDTRRRNFRRKQSVKLKRLKAEGKLHPDATYDDLQKYFGVSKEEETPTQNPAHPMSKSTGKRKRLGEDTEDKQTQTQTQTQMDESAELERRREELMARLADTAPDVEMTPVEPLSHIVEQVDQTISVSASPSMSEVSVSKESLATPTPPTKRLRPNVSAIGRILQRQAINIERKTSKPAKAPVADPEPEGSSDPNFWRSRVDLSAFECWDEEHELSAPPFPFEQHWDPASKLMREKKQAKKKKSRRSEQSTELLMYDNEDQEPEDTPVLDYDDSPETMKAASDPTDAAESQILQEVELAAKNDLPLLPDDVESLPMLQPYDVQVGAVIVFKVYAIDPVTVTPHISDFKTATVEKEGDSGRGAGTFRLKLAGRDTPQKANGGSVHHAVSGFRMDDDDEDEDDSIWEGTFGELVEPKLLKAAA